MARMIGKATVLRAGATPELVGEVVSVTNDPQGADIPINILGQSHGEGEVGQIDTTGEIVCNFNATTGATDPTPDAGQLELVVGSKVALELLPNGIGTGKPQIVGTVNVISRSIAVASANDIVQVTFTYRSDGEMVESAQV